MSYMTLMVPHTLFVIGIVWSPHMYVWSPSSYKEQLSYGPPHVHMFPSHVKCLPVLYYSHGPPIPYIE